MAMLVITRGYILLCLSLSIVPLRALISVNHIRYGLCMCIYIYIIIYIYIYHYIYISVYPICSMYGICIIHLGDFKAHVGKYSIHGASGYVYNYNIYIYIYISRNIHCTC